MWIGIIYFFVIIFSNTLGAISGMSGGVIIRPIFDAIGYHSVAAISFYSSTAVLTMSISSTYKQISRGMKLTLKLAMAMSIGAVFGGFLGNAVFDYLLNFFPDQYSVQLVQIVLNVLSLLFVLYCMREGAKTYRLQGVIWYVLSGLFLGFLATLLGIGGGPINVALLIMLFSTPIKEATVYSIITIFFSQLARMVSVATITGFGGFDLNILFFIVPAAILGGVIGSKLSYISSEKTVLKIFRTVVIGVIILNVVNGVRAVIG